MKNLSGYAAFPNEEAARKFYQRQKAKREVEKEAQAGSSVESETSNPEGKEAEHEIAQKVKDSAYEIIQRKRATYFGVAMAVKRICEVIVRDEKAILPVSTSMHGAYGINDVVLSMPCIVGADGIEAQVPIVLNDEETKKLQDSAKILRENINSTKRGKCVISMWTIHACLPMVSLKRGKNSKSEL